jgi:hypothetical protein
MALFSICLFKRMCGKFCIKIEEDMLQHPPQQQRQYMQHKANTNNHLAIHSMVKRTKPHSLHHGGRLRALHCAPPKVASNVDSHLANGGRQHRHPWGLQNFVGEAVFVAFKWPKEPVVRRMMPLDPKHRQINPSTTSNRPDCPPSADGDTAYAMEYVRKVTRKEHHLQHDKEDVQLQTTSHPELPPMNKEQFKAQRRELIRRSDHNGLQNDASKEDTKHKPCRHLSRRPRPGFHQKTTLNERRSTVMPPRRNTMPVCDVITSAGKPNEPFGWNSPIHHLFLPQSDLYVISLPPWPQGESPIDHCTSQPHHHPFHPGTFCSTHPWPPPSDPT